MLLAPYAGAAQGAPAAPDLHAPVSPAALETAQPVVTADAPAAPPPAERKHGIFPLWGDKVRAKGFDLPNPYTVMVNYYYQQSQLEIDNLRLGFNGGPMQDFSDVIQVPSAKAKASALAVRPSIMI